MISNDLSLQNVFKDDEEITWNNLEQLEYLTCVIKESLRLHPPVAVIAKEANQTVRLGGYEIPKGTSIIVPANAIHLSTENWESPLEFNPERFIRKGE